MTAVTASPRALRILVVDDEEPARRLLREFLAEERNVEVVGEAANGFEAVKAVLDHGPDLLLLDVQMPRLDGFEVLELLERPVSVVFVTAHDHHAVRAFEVNAVDFLLKPVQPGRLAMALERVRQALEMAPPAFSSEVAHALRPRLGYLGRVLVREGSQVHVIPVERLDWVEAQDDAILLHSQGRVFRKQQAISRLQARLDPDRFVRIHRSYLLNLDRLAGLDDIARENRVAVLRDGKRLPVSRAGYRRLRPLLVDEGPRSPHGEG